MILYLHRSRLDATSEDISNCMGDQRNLCRLSCAAHICTIAPLTNTLQFVDTLERDPAVTKIMSDPGSYQRCGTTRLISLVSSMETPSHFVGSQSIHHVCGGLHDAMWNNWLISKASNYLAGAHETKQVIGFHHCLASETSARLAADSPLKQTHLIFSHSSTKNTALSLAPDTRNIF